MKEKYSAPQIEVTTFESEEILVASSAAAQDAFAEFDAADFE